MGVLGRLKSSLSLHERVVEISRRSRGIALRAQALGNQAEALCRSGHLKEARDVAETAFNLMKDSGNSVIKYGLTATIAEIGITIGDYAAAHRALDQLREYANKNLAQYSRGHARYLSAWLSYEMGNNEDCLCNLDRLRRIESAEAPFYQRELAEILRAKIFLRRGFGEKSIKILQNLDRIVVKKRLPFQMCMTRLALAGSFIDSGSPHRANKPIRDALRLAKAMPSSHLEADAHLLLARMHKLNARSVSSITAPRTVSSPSVHRALEVTRSELLEALRLAKLSEAREQLWRIHAELAAAEEANADAPAALYQAKLAIKCMDELESLVPADSIDSYRKHPERVQARAECNRIIQESERTDFPTIAVRDMEEEHLRILFRISCAITSIRELESLLGTITTELIHSVGVERALVFLEEDGKGRLHLAKGLDRNGQFTVEADALNREVLDEVFRSRAPFVSANAQADPRLAGGGPPSDQTRGTVFCVPLVSGGRSLGVIYADHPHPSLLPAESTFNFLAAFSNLAASAIDNALVHDRLMQEKIELEHHLRQAREGFREIVGESDVMMRLRERIALAAASPLDVLIIGESGTGKELVARALHRMGRRASGNFITVDCGSLADTLAESEFFGYRKGSFTGAVENRAGLLEAAHGGVIFLDEISNLTIKLQGKLLRVLQEREVRRIGETAPRKIDLQVFAATNRNLKTEVDRGRFRKDLYYRLDQMQIRVAPLRERIEDVPLLAAVFLERESQAERVRAKSFCREALDVLSRYSFPGNVRELRNAVRSAHYSCPGSIIRVEHLPAEIREADEDSVGQEERSARLLYDRIRKGRGNFNDHVKEPFLKRQIARQTVRHLLSLALSSTGGWYRDALRQLRVPSKEYSPTLVFLKRHDCYLDFRPYRRRTGGDAGNSTGKQGRRVEDR